MELHTKQSQIDMNSAAAAQLWTPTKCLHGPSDGDSKRKILKRCCVSVIIRHDLVVVVIYLSQGYTTGGPWSYSKTNEITVKWPSSTHENYFVTITISNITL